MSAIIASVLSNQTPEDKSLNGDVFNDIKEFYEANPDKPEFIYDLVRPHVLDYARRPDEYLITHYSEVRPTNRADANIKLSIYTRYHSLLNPDVLRLFAEFRRKSNFRFYDNVPTFGEFCNPLHIYLRKHLVPETIKKFTAKNFKALYMLMLLVDLEETDQYNDNAFDLIASNNVDNLYLAAYDIRDYNIGIDILSKINHAIKSGVSSFSLKRKYLSGASHAENHKLYKELTRNYDINMDYCSGYMKITIKDKNSNHMLRPIA